MKHVFWILAVMLSLTSCMEGRKKDKAMEEEVIVKITPSDLKQLDLETIQLIDVRTPEENEEGTIQGAENMNCLDDDFMEKVAQLDKSKPVYLFCKRGGRSAKSAQRLAEAGFTKVYDLQGGITAWRAEVEEE